MLRASEGLSVFTNAPIVQRMRTAHNLTIVDFEAIRLFDCTGPRPLVEPVSRDEAPARLQRIAKRGLAGG
jgi:hypothetical protein